jgi:hypothetical protein
MKGINWNVNACEVFFRFQATSGRQFMEIHAAHFLRSGEYMVQYLLSTLFSSVRLPEVIGTDVNIF